MENYKLSYDEQYVLRSNRDTETTTLDVLANIQGEIASKCGVVSLNSRKAFDTVDHYILMESGEKFINGLKIIY